MSLSKRKRNVVTIGQKLNAIERIDKGESVHKICNELNVGKSTVNDWRRNRKSIEDFYSQTETEKVLTERRTLKKPTNEMVDEALWLWFLQERRRGTPISGPILKEKAMILHAKFEENTEFAASDGWLGRWKKRRGVTFVNICGDALAASDFLTNLKKIISRDKLLPEQVYNVDKTELNFKRLPQKTFSVGNAISTAGLKLNKERITVAICSNASGTHKLPLLVIGKSEKPRALKNVNVSSLPVFYRAEKSAWLKEWFINEFVPKVRKKLKDRKLPEKAILVLDNAGTHPTELQCEEAPGIKLLFLPTNVTSLIQPMDQGVIECLKRRYRRKLVSEILARMETEGMDLVSAVKSVNIKDAIYMTAKAYEEIPSSTYIKSWRKAWPDIKKEVNNTLDNELSHLETEQNDNVALLNDLMKLLPTSSEDEIVQQDVEEWMTGDDDLENEFMNDDQIVQAVVETETLENNVAEESEDERQEEKVSHEEGKKALQLAAMYIEQQEESTAADVTFIKKWTDIAIKKTIEIKKEKKITDFY